MIPSIEQILAAKNPEGDGSSWFMVTFYGPYDRHRGYDLLLKARVSKRGIVTWRDVNAQANGIKGPIKPDESWHFTPDWTEELQAWIERTREQERSKPEFKIHQQGSISSI